MLVKNVVRVCLPILGWIRSAYWFAVRPKTFGVKIVLTHHGRVLLVRHTYEPRAYGLPGGGLRRGEQPIDGITREAREELGLILSDPRALGTLFSDVEYRKDMVWVFTAEVDEAVLVPDEWEIAEAIWWDPRTGPSRPIGPMTREILDFFRHSRI